MSNETKKMVDDLGNPIPQDILEMDAQIRELEEDEESIPEDVFIFGHRFESVQKMPIELRYGWCGASDDEYYCCPNDSVILFYTPKGSSNDTKDAPIITEHISDEAGNMDYRVWIIPTFQVVSYGDSAVECVKEWNSI